MKNDYKSRFLELYNLGLNDTQIAEKIGVSQTLISFERRRLGMKSNHAIIDVERFLELYHAGHNDAEIGRMMGFGASAIFQRRKSMGLASKRGIGSEYGAKNPSWRGGRILDKSGYVLVLAPDHPHKNSGGYVREHRLVMEKHLGRYLEKSEVVHHINDNKEDNRIENLELFDKNSLHLGQTLKGKTPKWTQEGRERTMKGLEAYLGSEKNRIVAREAGLKRRGMKLSAEHKAKISEKSKEMWNKPEMKEMAAKRMAERNHKNWQDPEYRARMAEHRASRQQAKR